MTRRAHTLVELLVVLTILGTVGIMAAPALRSPALSETATLADSIRSSSRRAIREGRAVTISIRHEGRVQYATAFPDGRVLADSGTTQQLVILPGSTSGR